MGLPERLVAREGARWQATFEPSESQQCKRTMTLLVAVLGSFCMFMTFTVPDDPSVTTALDGTLWSIVFRQSRYLVLVVGLCTYSFHLLYLCLFLLVLVLEHHECPPLWLSSYSLCDFDDDLGGHAT